MSFAISIVSSIPTITQSGTDTSWSGIDTMISSVAAVAVSTAYTVDNVRKPPAYNGFWYRCTTLGTTAAVAPLYNPVSGSTTTDGSAVFTAFLAPFSFLNGSLRKYDFPEVDFVINGTLTITNPMFETCTCRRWHTSSSCIYTSGSFMVDGITPKFNGTHFTTTLKGTVDYQEVSNWDGAWAIRGGTIELAASIKPQGTSSQNFYTVTFVSSANWSRSIRFRAYNTQTQFLNGCRFYNIAFDAFNVPLAMSAKGFASEYVSEYVGSSAGGTDSKMTIFALSNQDGQFDFDDYGGGWIEIYNCSKGAALDIRSLGNSALHCVPLFQDINFIVTNLQGVAQDNVRFSTTDAPTNSPTVTITTASSLKTWDFRSPITLTGITSGGGLSSSSPCLKVWHGTTNIQNLRYPASTATYRFCGYSAIQQDVTVVLGLDTAITKGVAMQSATFLSLTEAQANAITGISLVASGSSGGTVTLTSTHTDAELWQYFRAWKPSNLASNDIWSFDGVSLNIVGWSLVGLEFLTGGITASTASAGSILTNVNVTGNASQTIPTNLTNVKITGTLSYNTNSPISITYSNTTLGTVLNSGTGIVTITPSGTVTIGDYTNSKINFLDSTLTLLNATSAIVYSSSGNRDSNTSPGATITTPLLFKYGSVVSGVLMSGTVYFRVTSGTTIMLSSLTLALGANVLDLGTPGQIALLPTITSANVWNVTSASYSTSGTFGYDHNVVKTITSLLPGTGNY